MRRFICVALLIATSAAAELSPTPQELFHDAVGEVEGLEVDDVPELAEVVEAIGNDPDLRERYADVSDARRQQIRQLMRMAAEQWVHPAVDTPLQRTAAAWNLEAGLVGILHSPNLARPLTPELERQINTLATTLTEATVERFPEFRGTALVESLQHEYEATLYDLHRDDLAPAMKAPLPDPLFDDALTSARQTLLEETEPHGRMVHDGGWAEEWGEWGPEERREFMEANAEHILSEMSRFFRGAKLDLYRRYAEFAMETQFTDVEMHMELPDEYQAEFQALMESAAREREAILANQALESEQEWERKRERLHQLTVDESSGSAPPAQENQTREPDTVVEPSASSPEDADHTDQTDPDVATNRTETNPVLAVDDVRGANATWVYAVAISLFVLSGACLVYLAIRTAKRNRT